MPSPLSRLLTYARRYRRNFKRASAFSILNKFFDIAPEILIGVAVDVVVEREESLLARIGIVEVLPQLLTLAALTLIIWVLESVFEYLYNLEWRNLAQNIQHDLRLDAYSQVQRLDLSYFEDRSSGGLVSILNDDINQLERFLDGGANSLIQVATAVVLVGAVFFALAPLVAALALLPIPIILIGAFRYQRLAEPRYLAVREHAAVLGGRLANNISGIMTIKSQTAEQHEREQVRRESEAYVEANRSAIKVSSAFTPLIRMAILAGFLSTLVTGGWMTLQGSLAVGSYSVLVFLTQRLLWPLTTLAQTVDLYQRAMASTKRVLDLLDTPVDIPELGRPLPKESVKGAVEFRNVSFSYPRTDRPVFRGLSLTIPAGSTIGLVGTTGAGKSTLLKLLLRFYRPTDGAILLDGAPIEDCDLTDLRKAIGFVSQDVFLVHGTVRENIVYGRFDASFEEIERAARDAEAEQFIRGLPQGYDTVVGERGQKLSGGQRQRLALARALLKDPPILVLDEATSAVDNETELLIQRSLQKVARGRTTFLIAHRLSTIRHCDTIYLIDEGQIREQGTHPELVEQGGIYARLWRLQTGEIL